MKSQNLLEHVRSVFVRLTRYPDEVVTAEADLEQDLGIDSVKRGEILAALRTEFGLANALKATPDELRTVARVADFLARSLATGGANGRPAVQAPAPSDARPDTPTPAAPPRAPAVASAPPAELARGPLDVVVEVLAAVTRHPIALLVPGARLEEDLGIDRRRRDEVHALLRRRGSLPDALAGSLDAASTVGDLARLLPATPHPNGAAARSPQTPATLSATTAPASTLAGKTVLVTGSSRGLGRAIAAALGRAGARVVVNSFHSRDEGEAVAAEIRGAGGASAHVWGSVANPAHVEAIFDTITRDVGELHGFVSNASNGRFGPLEQTTPEHWELAFRTNVIG
ncbi:MAG: SDR family NAD(P)-dependent oxidoreductase, partial [Byssovorax sp.]